MSLHDHKFCHTKKKKKLMLLTVTYVINGLNESTQSLVLSYTYNFNNSSLRKKNYVIQPKNDLEYDEGYWIQIAKRLETQLDDVVYNLPEIDKVT